MNSDKMDKFLACCLATVCSIVVLILGMLVGFEIYHAIKHGEFRRTIRVEVVK